jgi:hypothetical protein
MIVSNQDFYYSSESKETYEKNYNFTLPLDVNINLKGEEKLKFKLCDFTIMNTMLNVSSAHKNNTFDLVIFSVAYTITIPDGNYTAVSLRDWLNDYMTTNTHPISFNYDKSTNRYWLLTSVGITGTDLIFYPKNCASLFGFTKKFSYVIQYPNEYYSDTFVNMLPYTKIILTTNLSFDTNTQQNLAIPYRNGNNGIGNIVNWFSRDVPPFTTINYNNNEGIEIELSNRNLKSINFNLINEYQEYIYDAPICLLHFQLITYDNTNWYKKFFNVLNDISYYLISLYWRR